MTTRRSLVRNAALLAAGAALPTPSRAQRSSRNARPNTLRIIHAADLQSLDPVWTTSASTKDYAFLTYDQLIAVDADNIPRPQMAEGWTVEDDGRSYVISLRDGLRFHDGEPVRAQDCIASIARWSARDGFGQALRRVTDRMEAIDDRRLRIRLKRPFPLLPAAIGKSNSSQCFIMPERVAKTDPSQQITEWVGSGPFRFLRDEWVSGSHASWAKFEHYVPRREPVSSIAGGRIPAVDRVEWGIIGDSATALSALISGEYDYWDQPSLDLLPAIESRRNLVVDVRNPSGVYAMLQFNHLQPPFNNPEVRRAVALGVDQASFLQSATSRPEQQVPCTSFYACGTAYGTDDGAEVLKEASLEAARAALRSSGYNGEKAVVLAVQDHPMIAPMSLVAADLLRRIGINTELVSTDFATMVQRRTNRDTTDRGGWSVFLTTWTGTDILNPAVNQMLRGPGASGWFGWPDDPVLEDLRNQWFDTSDTTQQARLAKELQVQAFKTLPYIPLGGVVRPVAYSRELTGVFPVPVQAYWNIGKRR
ncbi:ABC transporter substrate-binding protein [Roseococcus pinisoli]|uniref:ABC transporter substrate-binding protein n=1 Tax=Roseococcus pinisoli TaxID=2835040 RepID=A0ABS5QIZ2_9PROT|nr:ABC transporter substrate-binding protein [Roseococcus pinisoli]MBS7813655.1 ABC transporter substrate-binding protein [Roseococcus pinisoli]